MTVRSLFKSHHFNVIGSLILLSVTNFVHSSVFITKAYAEHSRSSEALATPPKKLEDIFNETYRDKISEPAELTHPNVISFVNKRLSEEKLIELKSKLLELELEVTVKKELQESDNYYLCVNNYLPGFPNEIEIDRTELDLKPTPITVLAEEPKIITDPNQNEHIFWRIDYEGTAYWSKKGINYADGREDLFIAKYKDCPKIQNLVLTTKLEERAKEIAAIEAQGNMSLPIASSGFIKYVCTEDDPLNAYSQTETRELLNEKITNSDNDAQLPKGTQVVQVQGKDQDPFVAKNGHEYVYVQVQRDFESDNNEFAHRRFWVAKAFIKRLEDCASVQTKPVITCSKNKVPLYDNDYSLGSLAANTETEGFSSLYRLYGEFYDKKIILNSKNQEEVYVPVSFNRRPEKVYWVSEKLIPSDCPINPERPIDYRSSTGETCNVLANDNFPLSHPSKNNFYAKPGRYYNNRPGGRKHAGVDLYSHFAWSFKSNNRYGGSVTAIARGVVTSINKWDHTHYIVVESAVKNETWLYGELDTPKVSLNQIITPKKHLARTEKYILYNPEYPAMAHIEKYSTRSLKNYKGGGLKRRHSSNVNPSCHIEYTSKRKFNGKIWEND